MTMMMSVGTKFWQYVSGGSGVGLAGALVAVDSCCSPVAVGEGLGSEEEAGPRPMELESSTRVDERKDRDGVGVCVNKALLRRDEGSDGSEEDDACAVDEGKTEEGRMGCTQNSACMNPA